MIFCPRKKSTLKIILRTLSSFFYLSYSLRLWAKPLVLNKPMFYKDIYFGLFLWLKLKHSDKHSRLTENPSLPLFDHFPSFLIFQTYLPFSIPPPSLSLSLIALIPLSMTWPQYLNVNKNNLPHTPPSQVLYSLIFHFFLYSLFILFVCFSFSFLMLNLKGHFDILV